MLEQMMLWPREVVVPRQPVVVLEQWGKEVVELAVVVQVEVGQVFGSLAVEMVGWVLEVLRVEEAVGQVLEVVVVAELLV